MRYKMTIEYDGSPFCGWQRQKDANTVQGTIERALSHFVGSPMEIHGSGRTDSGVHAKGQVAHFDVDLPYPPFEIQGALNYRLKHHPISILKVEEVSDDFHSRFSALKRAYKYVILNRRAPPTFEMGRVWWVAKPLDHLRMQEAARHLVGTHDFTSFRDSCCQAKSPIKTIDYVTVEREGDHITLAIQSKSFLHHQVRNIAGTLKKIGEGSWEPSFMADLLEIKDRTQGGPTAPPDGLYLTEIQF